MRIQRHHAHFFEKGRFWIDRYGAAPAVGSCVTVFVYPLLLLTAV